MAEGGEGLPEAFQVDTWDDDYKCEEEEEGEGKEELLKRRQSQASELGMIKVSDADWTDKVMKKMSDITGKEWTEKEAKHITRAIQKASKANCLVRRGCNSQERIEHHERLARKARDAQTKKYHEEKARKKSLSLGTGMLLAPWSPLGYLVVTNNHVVMNEEEAKGAQVLFNYLTDGSKEGTKVYGVRQLVVFSPLTESAEDWATLDFSILILETNPPNKFLDGTDVMYDSSDRIYMHVGAPLIMFSHPLNLAMRVSVGPCPKHLPHPVEHIRHALPTDKGSSGSNLLYWSSSNDSFKFLSCAFVHYRHGLAVAWQAIGPMLADKFDMDLSKKCQIKFGQEQSKQEEIEN